MNRTTNTNGKYTIWAAIITGGLGLIATITAAIIGNNTGKNNAVSEVISQVNTDIPNVNITIDNKADLIDLLKDLIDKNAELLAENSNLAYSNIELQNENNTLKEEKEVLLEENKSLRDQLAQHSDLENENKDLEKQVTSLKDENSSLQNEIDTLKRTNDLTPAPSSMPTGKKVSIFDLDTFQGNECWQIPNNEEYYTDTYGNQYLTSHIGLHHKQNRESYYVPTYLLDNMYSICEGKIAWAKKDKNEKHSIWIEFYSGEELIFSTEPMVPTDRPIEFEFSVEGKETLTIILNSTINTVNDNIHIIYEYLNLVE